MKNVWVLLLLLNWSHFGCAQKKNELGTADFEKGLGVSGVQVLDVRTAGEFQSGHIKNALQADWSDQTQFRDRIAFVDKSRPVYVYCLAGGRSHAAAEWMRKNGFQDVKELIGGINAWKRDNKPVEGASNEPQMTLAQYKASIPSNKTVLVDFGASWCPPCVQMNPVLEELQQEKDLKFQLIKIDGGVHTNLMKELNLEPIPVFILYKKGQEVWRHQGIISKEELRKILK